MTDQTPEGDERPEESGPLNSLDESVTRSEGIFETLPPALPVADEPVATAAEKRGAKRKKEDPWAHRRGEPRVFAFLWTVYLLVATTTALVSLGLHGAASVDAYRPVARNLLLAIAVGVTFLWPMLRLSQKKPKEGGIAATAKDVVVMLVPAQAVIWPQWWLAHWPLSVVVCVALMISAWTLIVGAVLAVALGENRGGKRDVPHRALWMGVFVALAVAGPVAMAVRAGVRGLWLGPDIPDAVAMGSPLSGVYELTRERFWSGSSAQVDQVHWIAVGVAGIVGLALWWALPLRHRGHRLRSSVH